MNHQPVSVLLLEDDDVDVMNVRRAFKKIKINNPLLVASDGEQGLEILRQAHRDPQAVPPRIILLDLNMPKMNGIEFLTELRADPLLRSAVVFVLTTSADDRDKIAAYNLNVAGYILKPVEWQNFVQAMASLDVYWSMIEMPEEGARGSDAAATAG